MAGAGTHVRIDMHVHTAASYDCRSEPVAVVERAVRSGLDRVCITDHDEIDAALDLKRRCPDRVIVGEEVRTGEGVDIIGLFIHDRIPGGTAAREVCDRIHDQGGLVYVPHPFAGGKGGGGRLLPEIEDRIDILEGFNARLHPVALNERATAWAEERGMPVGAGSDAHTLAEVGRGWVDVRPFDDRPDSFLDALRAGTIHGRTSSRLVHVASTLAKALP